MWFKLWITNKYQINYTNLNITLYYKTQNILTEIRKYMTNICKALQLCVKLRVFINEVPFLRETVVIYSYILVHQI